MFAAPAFQVVVEPAVTQPLSALFIARNRKNYLSLGCLACQRPRGPARVYSTVAVLKMESASDPLYIYYNGPANLQELEGVNLAGARIFLNGSYSLRDLRNVNFRGATVFMNGQQTVTFSPDSHFLPS